MQNNPVTFLLVEDDDIDFWAMERALKRLRISNPIIRTTDAFEAQEFLSCKSKTQNLAESLIILLDINLPGMNGLKFLEGLRNDARYKNLSVIVTTTSDANCDLQTAAEHDVAGYVLKSDLTEGLQEVFESMNIVSQISLKPQTEYSTGMMPSLKWRAPELATA